MNNDIRGFLLEASYKRSYLYEEKLLMLGLFMQGKKITNQLALDGYNFSFPSSLN